MFVDGLRPSTNTPHPDSLKKYLFPVAEKQHSYRDHLVQNSLAPGSLKRSITKIPVVARTINMVAIAIAWP